MVSESHRGGNTGVMMISIIIPVYNGKQVLNQCLEAVHASAVYAAGKGSTEVECIVVDDGSTDGTPEVAGLYPCKLIALEGGPFGPAHARNQGAQAASGDLLFFIDADVLIQPDTLVRVVDAFQKMPGIAALFGSYDETPASGEFLSQYKNLLHHFVHQQAHQDAATFWSGCGAIRRSIFLELGGFDATRYPKPSIEDIDLGYRLKAAGYKILLDKEIQVKHLKRWSLASLIKTDILHRAIPWTMLIMQHKSLPNDLNLKLSQRLSTVLLLALLLYMGIFSFRNHLLLLPLVTSLFLVLFSGWNLQEETSIFQMSKPVEKSSFFLMGVIGIAALFSNQAQLIAPLVLLLPLMLAGNTLSNGGPVARSILFATMMLVLAVEFALLLASYPIYLVAPFIVILGIILVLNSQLYLFFARKRGIVFALASIPLQLIYYLYSIAAFVIGGGIHLLNSGSKAKQLQ
jgi:glycosyltransferase involved in cell wall biosynthesis